MGEHSFPDSALPQPTTALYGPETLQCCYFTFSKRFVPVRPRSSHAQSPRSPPLSSIPLPSQQAEHQGDAVRTGICITTHLPTLPY